MSGKAKTPGAVIGAGILLISYGAMVFLLCGVLVGALLFLPGDADAEAMVVKDLPGFAVVKFGEPISNMIVGLLLIVLGLGVMRLSRAARLGVYLVSTYQILVVIAGALYRAIYLFPLMQEVFDHQFPEVAHVLKNFKWVIVGILILIPVVFCLPAILLLRLKSSRAAFTGDVLADPPDRERSAPRYEGYDDGYNNS